MPRDMITNQFSENTGLPCVGSLFDNKFLNLNRYSGVYIVSECFSSW